METPEAYIPIDRRAALAARRELPSRSYGAALFADVSGFTPLTEALVRALGPQRGAEELSSHLNRVYDALIAEVDRFGGAVLAFSGDAITCWFDADDGTRATTCALALQQAMRELAEIAVPRFGTVALAIKVAIAAGHVRRFLVGDPGIQLIDVIAGKPLEALAEAEHRARKGDVVLDPQTSAALQYALDIAEWRAEPGDARPYAVVRGLRAPHPPTPWPASAYAALGDEQVSPWLLPPVYERLHDGLGEFLTELRPATALFLRFGGIDYDHDQEAGAQLDAYIRWVQGVLTRYGGFLLQLAIGDKGSYICAAFGAPVAHGDDAVRAVAAALELRAPPPELRAIRDVQIGMSQGIMRAGAYGGSTRRTYGLLGDHVNLAARLMQHAAPGGVLVSDAVYNATRAAFAWQPIPPVAVKGKSAPVAVFQALAAQDRQTAQQQESRYALPMIGRAAELAAIADTMTTAQGGRGQIVAITAEAGMGKSRMIDQIARLARERGFACFGGDCQSYGTNNSYLVWEGIWRAFFAVDETQTADALIEHLHAQLAAIGPGAASRLPLLGVALNFPIPDNELTGSLDAKLRKTSLEALLVDCVRARAQQGPLFLVLEDCHWLDALSHDLLEMVARSITQLPVLIVIAYRPPSVGGQPAPRVVQLPHCTITPLTEFTAAEAAQLIASKLAHRGVAAAELPGAFVERIIARAQGNPFFIDELLNYVYDRGLDPRDPALLKQLDLPTTLHSLILSRIDQLSESQKLTIKVASVIGRLFRESWLHGVYPALGAPAQLRANLDALSRLDLTPLDQPEPELTYLFKHIVTREVAYESLPFSTRARLHGNFGHFVEHAYADALDQYSDLLAYHYDLSEDTAKRRQYLRTAGEAAQAAYANEAAIDYYTRLLPLLEPGAPEFAAQRQQTHARLGELYANTGQYDAALGHLDAALALTDALHDHEAHARVCRWMAYVHEFRGDYPLALAWIERGLAALQALPEKRVAAEAELLAIAGLIATRQGDYAQAQTQCARGIEVAEALGESTALAFAYNARAIIAYAQGQSADAIASFQKAFAVYERTGNIHGQAMSWNGIGNAYQAMGQWGEAAQYLARARETFHQTGDVLHLAFADNNLGEIARNQGRLDDALAAYSEALGSMQQLGASLYALGVLHMNLGATFIRKRELGVADQHLQTSKAYFAQASARDFLPELQRYFAEAALAAGNCAEADAHAQEALRFARELTMRGEEGTSLRVLGEVAICYGQLDRARQHLDEALAILQEVEYELEAARTHFWLAKVYAEQGQRDQCSAALAQAIATFERLGATADLRLADGLKAAT